MSKYQNEIICDMAEYYGVFNLYALPFSLFATLVMGLRADSRLMMALAEQKHPLNISLQAMEVDALNYLVWTKSKDAQRGKNRPKSIYELLHGEKEKAKGFDTIEDFERARLDIMRNGKDG